MEFFFFGSKPGRYAAAFTRHYVVQNRKSLRLIANLVAVISALVLLSSLFVPYQEWIPGYRALRTNTLFLGATATFVSLAEYLLRPRPLTPFVEKTIRVLSFAYAYLFVTGCFFVTYLYQHNPKNSMGMYLLGLMVVATLLNFRVWENLALMLLLEATFAVTVFFTDIPLGQKIMNHFGSVFILVCYFVLARTFSNYRTSHFVQLREIEEKKRQLEAVSRAKSEVLGVVAHDLRTPFASVEMFVGLIQKGRLPVEQQNQAFGLIIESCQKSRVVIDNLLEMARFEHDTTFDKSRTDLNTYLAKALAEWQHQAEGRTLAWQPAQQALYVNLNEQKFQRVLDNLLSNAVKFTSASGHIQVRVRQANKKVLLQVADNGVGIPESLKPHLFEPFSKASRKGLQGQQSVGLGLSISRTLVEQHGGTIAVESAENQGTTFHITLPACG